MTTLLGVLLVLDKDLSLLLWTWSLLGDLLLGDKWCWLSDFSRDVKEESGVTGDDSDDVTGFGVTLGDQDDEEAEGVEDDDDVPREAMDIFDEGVPIRLPLWLLLGVMLEAEELQVKSRILVHTTFLPEYFTCFFLVSQP